MHFILLFNLRWCLMEQTKKCCLLAGCMLGRMGNHKKVTHEWPNCNIYWVTTKLQRSLSSWLTRFVVCVICLFAYLIQKWNQGMDICEYLSYKQRLKMDAILLKSLHLPTNCSENYRESILNLSQLWKKMSGGLYSGLLAFYFSYVLS